MILFEKEKHIVKILHKEKEGFRVLRQFKVKPDTNKIRYKNLTFIVDLSMYTYRDGLKFYYCITINSKQLEFLTSDEKVKKELERINKKAKDDKKTLEIEGKTIQLDDIDISAEVVDDILFNGMVRDILLASEKPDWKFILIYVGLGILIGGAFGYIIGQAITMSNL